MSPGEEDTDSNKLTDLTFHWFTEKKSFAAVCVPTDDIFYHFLNSEIGTSIRYFQTYVSLLVILKTRQEVKRNGLNVRKNPTFDR